MVFTVVYTMVFTVVKVVAVVTEGTEMIVVTEVIGIDISESSESKYISDSSNSCDRSGNREGSDCSQSSDRSGITESSESNGSIDSMDISDMFSVTTVETIILDSLLICLLLF